MRIKKLLFVVVAVALVSMGLLAGRTMVKLGNPDSPSAPSNTYSYTLEDIYNRLNDGTEGDTTTFTEPAVGPGTGTMHTLNEIMDKAPVKDDANGADTGDVLTGKTFWGLTSGQWGLQTGTATLGNTYNAGVPKTGQDKCYTAAASSEQTCPAAGFPGQDGDHQKGVTWPNPRFTVSGDTVTDNLTGLIWLKDANCINTHHGTYNFDNDGTAGDGAVTWQHALDFVAGINAGTYSNCGGPHTDWRLPNVRELLSLIHYGFYDPAVPNTAGTGQWSAGDPFNNVQSGRYWSSTTCAGAAYTNYAPRVDMKQGNTTLFTKTSVYYVWPVRGP